MVEGLLYSFPYWAQFLGVADFRTVFFFVYSLYSYATYLDHDEYYVQSVSPPQSACSGTVQAPFCPPPRPIPQGASA